MEKISRIYSERREKEIAVRICYDVTVDDGFDFIQADEYRSARAIDSGLERLIVAFECGS